MTFEPSRNQEPKEEEIPLVTFEPSSEEAKGKVKQYMKEPALPCVTFDESNTVLSITVVISHMWLFVI